MKVENIEKFKSFLDHYLETPYGCYSLDACVNDLVKKWGETGYNSYELCPFETKSGMVETIGFNVNYSYFVDGMEVPPCGDYDYTEMTISF